MQSVKLHEIQSLAARYHEHPAEPIGPFLQRILRDVAARIAAQIASLQAQQQRIQELQAAFAEASSDPPSAALAQMLNAECDTPFGGFARGGGHS